MFRVLIMLLLFAIPFRIKSQVFPKDGGNLSYRIIGFSFPADKQASKYKIEIAAGNCTAEDAFAKNIIVTATGDKNKIIAEVPAFGSAYTWRVVYAGRKKGIRKSVFYHFSTEISSWVDTSKTRLKILHAAEAHKGDYVAVEGGGVIYDMKGNPVWYISDSTGIGGNVMNIKFTPQGTITCMAGQGGYEINYKGNVLWKTPGRDTVSSNGDEDYFHHDFTRLANGHYMILGTELMLCKMVTVHDSTYITGARYKTQHTLGKGGIGVKNAARFGTIIEFDENRKVVWSWKSSKYLLASDYAYFQPADSSQRYDPHDNAFFFDEKNNAVYLGWRNLSRIVKIDYPSGKVVQTCGEIFKAGMPAAGNGMFCNQHNIGRTHDGYLYIFNNNFCGDTTSSPKVVMLREPTSENDTLKKVWEYTCSADGKTGGFPSGGNAIELPDSSMFICMGSYYGKLLIVNRDKQILWSALPETYDADEKKWKAPKQYRANIISRKELERIIWKGE